MRLLTLARDLKRRKSRERHGLFTVEGVRAVEELLGSGLVVHGALMGPQLLETPRGAALHESMRSAGWEVQPLPPKELSSAADTDSPQGVIAIAEVPQRSFDSLPADWSGMVLLLDAVQDPGNVGTLIRTAAAMGAIATVALPGTVDLWNAKVVRGGMGAHFRHTAFSTSWEALDAFRAGSGTALFAADGSGAEITSVGVPARTALVVGNEGSGLSSQSRARADRVVGLRLAPGVESLNVAVAAGILLYSLKR